MSDELEKIRNLAFALPRKEVKSLIVSLQGFLIDTNPELKIPEELQKRMDDPNTRFDPAECDKIYSELARLRREQGIE